MLNLNEFLNEWTQYVNKSKVDYENKPGNLSAVSKIEFDAIKLVSI